MGLQPVFVNKVLQASEWISAASVYESCALHLHH